MFIEKAKITDNILYGPFFVGNILDIFTEEGLIQIDSSSIIVGKLSSASGKMTSR